MNFKRRTMALLVAAMLIVAALTGCGGSTGSAASGSGAGGDSGTPRTAFHMGMNAEPTSMDPAECKDLITRIFIMQVYDPLLTFDWQTQEYVPAIASDWEVNEDSSEVLFTIRDDMKFHNGDTLTVDDVMFSLERSLASSYLAQLSGSIDHFEKVDDSHIKVVLKYGYAPILDVLSNPSWSIVSKRAVEEAEAEGKDFGRDVACGTGAYKLTNWQSGASLSFEAFDEYWGGAPYFKTVEATLITDQSAGAIALEEGTLDYYYGLQNNDLLHLADNPDIAIYECDGGVGLFDITFNCTDGIFTDVRLRKAVALALNRDDLLLAGREGMGVVTDCFCATAASGYDPDFEWYDQNLEEAKPLLAEAGYPDGFDVVFTQDSSKTYMTAAEVMQGQLAQIGINVTFDKLERATWLDTVSSNRQFVASLRMTNMEVLDADYLLTRRLTTDYIGGGNNYAGYSNPEFDALVAEARTLSDSAARQEIYDQCYEIIKEDVPVIPLYTDANSIAARADIKGFFAHPLYRIPWSGLYIE